MSPAAKNTPRTPAAPPSARKPPLFLFLLVGVVVLGVLAVVLAVATGGDDDADSSASGSDTTAVAGATVVQFGAPTVTGTPLPDLTGDQPDPAIGTVAPTVEGQTPANEPASIAPGRPELVVFLAHCARTATTRRTG